MLDPSRRLEVAYRLVDEPLSNALTPILRAVGLPEAATTVWQPLLSDEIGTDFRSILALAAPMRLEPPGTARFVQRLGYSLRRIAGAVLCTRLDGLVLQVSDTTPLSVEIRSALAEHATAQFDERGSLLLLSSATNEFRFDVDATGHVRHLNSLGRFTVDDRDRIRYCQLRGGRSFGANYDDLGRLVSLSSSTGEALAVRYASDSVDQVAWFDHTHLGSWYINPAPGGWLAVSQDAGVWRTAFDSLGCLVSETSPDAEVRQVERDAANGAVSSISEGAHLRELFYDLDGYVVAATDSDGSHCEFAYDADGRLVSADIPEEERIKRVFDSQGRLVSSSTADQHVEMAWSSDTGTCWRPGNESDAIEIREGRAVGGPSSRWTVRQVAGTSTCWLVSSEGTQLYFASSGSAAQWGAADGWRRSIALHPQGTPLDVQDDAHRISVERDGRGQITSMGTGVAIDWELRRVARVRAGSSVEEREYNSQGLLTSLHRNGELFCAQSLMGGRRHLYGLSPRTQGYQFELSASGRIRRLSSSEGTLEFLRDGLGKVCEASSNGSAVRLARREGRLESDVGSLGQVRIARDGMGRRIGVVTSRGLNVEMERGSAGHLAALREGSSGAELRFRYDIAGREVERKVGRCSVRVQRDAMGRVVHREVCVDERRLDATELRWGGAQLLQATSTQFGPARTYQRDSNGHLTGLNGSSFAVGISPLSSLPLEGVVLEDRGLPLQVNGARYVFGTDGSLRTLLRDGEAYSARLGITGSLSSLVGLQRRTEVVRDPFGRSVGRVVQRLATSDGRHERPVAPESEEQARVSACAYAIWDAVRPVHRWTEGGSEHTYVWADGLLVLVITDGEPYVVIPDHAGDAEALMTLRGDLVWVRDPRTLIFGLPDEGAIKYGVPSLPDHFYDPETGFWESLFRTFDSASARYLAPNPLGLAAGPALNALGADPIGQRMRFGIGKPLLFWNELEADTFDLRWTRFVLEQLTCPQDERGLRAWRSFDEDLVPDPQRWLLQLAGLVDE
ncbi:MAG: hypothetical protein IT378_01055 [Sandaracinaceae bacterium]|nr:hypothetical protein [Sandaracinaceae bacterium]